MSVKFKLKSRENWVRFPLDRLNLDQELKDRFLESCPEIPAGLIEKILSIDQLGSYSFYLDEDHLGLAEIEQKPLYIDIESALNYHTKVYENKGYKNEPFYKSIKSKDMNVIDITCGMMGDSLLMHSWGFEIQAYEANPITSCLILNALKNRPLKNFKFIAEEFNFDFYSKGVVFYDPFFRKTKEKTMPKKSMQVLRDFDHYEILDRPSGIKKVVVKRPKGAEQIWSEVHHQYHGKSVRYDVYSC